MILIFVYTCYIYKTMETTNSLITKFLSDEPLNQKLATIEQMIYTYNLPLSVDELYTFYDATKILPELGLILDNVINYFKTYGCYTNSTLDDVRRWLNENNNYNISEAYYEKIRIVQVSPNNHNIIISDFPMYPTSINNLIKNINRYIKYLLLNNKNLFVALVKYINADTEINHIGLGNVCLSTILFNFICKQFRIIMVGAVFDDEDGIQRIQLTLGFIYSTTNLLDYYEFDVSKFEGVTSNKKILLEYYNEKYGGSKTKCAKLNKK